MATKFYKCAHCGNVILKVVDSKVPVVCCGEKMQELKKIMLEGGIVGAGVGVVLAFCKCGLCTVAAGCAAATYLMMIVL